LAAASRLHELQAPSASMSITAAPNVTITDFRMAFTETRLSMLIPSNLDQGERPSFPLIVCGVVRGRTIMYLYLENDNRIF
jgi:hypothetical protein